MNMHSAAHGLPPVSGSWSMLTRQGRHHRRRAQAHGHSRRDGPGLPRLGPNETSKDMFTFIATALLKGVEDLGLTASGCSIPERPRHADFDYCWCVRRRRSALRAVRTGPVHSTSMHPAFIGSFQILRELGRGGMGVLYLATDAKLDRQVAIKGLLADLAKDPDRLARFQREAKVHA